MTRMLLAAAVVVFALLLLDPPLRRSTAPPDSTTEGSACVAVPPTVAAKDRPLGSDGVALYRNGIVILRVCKPGRLTVRARGTAVAGRGPHVVIATGSERAWEGAVEDREIVEVGTLSGGWIAIAFVNDASGKGGDRNLWLETVAFTPHSP